MSAPVYYRTETETEKIYTVIPDYLYDTNTKTLVKTTAPTPIPPPTTTGVDKFGVKMLNPTKSGGREWYLNAANWNDGQFYRKGGVGGIETRSDGSLFCSGDVRLYVQSPEPFALWKNVEITGYYYIETGVSGRNAIQHYGRGGIHTTSQYTMQDGSKKYGDAIGTKLSARLYSNGDVLCAKEMGHPAYGPYRGAKSSIIPDPVGPRRWLGWKVVINQYKNAAGKECAKVEGWIDDNAQDSSGKLQVKNNWKLLTSAVDEGDWSCAGTDLDGIVTRCGLPPGVTSKDAYAKMILTWPGDPRYVNDKNNRKIACTASFRWDDLGVKYKFLSVREIVPGA